MSFYTVTKIILLLALWGAGGFAHMQMSKPLPIRSPLDLYPTGPVDYGYTNPLNASGKNYPCKGYEKDPFVSQAFYVPESSYETKIQGNAPHGGGSCQLSLSYDQGQSFRVIQSMVGGCGFNRTWPFKIPREAPPGEALFAWTWFNRIGNREMYMNCAMVTIGDAPDSWNDNKNVTNSPKFESLPEIFIANINGEGKCVTSEDQDVSFPLPGPKVIGKSDSKGYNCTEDAAFLDKSPTKQEPNPKNNSGQTTLHLSDLKLQIIPILFCLLVN
ncbi:hypothetical protein N7527_007761 [Penicillium freii]|uniref:Chitin-binding type-4 domain-containing protein n=1 Tax=Penicillium freii TaxID=48697 RepID=A0A101MAB2_PENFR|nr:hypothetical protein N7527_007761 [Penicillium freii]KUM56899.1 hypothetical protein ACN42_g10297 [Penicillium freii]